MRTLAFDGRTGASGDLLLAAPIAAGADLDVLAPVEDALPIRYDVGTETRHGVSATTVTVRRTDDGGGADGRDDADGDADDAAPDPADHDPETHDHGGGGDGDAGEPAEGAGPHRSYEEVLEILDGLAVPDRVADDARAIFERLGEAEAAVHGTALEEIHFHEVGADDAIADVVGAALLVDDLDVERIVTTPLAAGGGEVAMAHGTYPVPAPAVVELAEAADWTLRGGPVDEELLTPTGAAILAHFADGVDSLPAMDVAASGYGAGSLTLEDRPNVLRAVVGETDGGLVPEDVTVLETNLDDASPEVLGDLQRSLAEVGARDVSVLPATMKKSRPGHLVKVICRPADAERVARRLAEETGTLGVREHGAAHRWIARRTIRTATLEVAGETYEVDVKVAGTEDGTVFDVSAEHDDAVAVADATDLPLREVTRRAEAAVDDGPIDAAD